MIAKNRWKQSLCMKVFSMQWRNSLWHDITKVKDPPKNSRMLMPFYWNLHLGLYINSLFIL